MQQQYILAMYVHVATWLLIVTVLVQGLCDKVDCKAKSVEELAAYYLTILYEEQVNHDLIYETCSYSKYVSMYISNTCW